MDRNKFESIFVQVPAIQQYRDDLYNVVNYIENINPKVIVEIGVAHGGSLNLWRNIIKDDGIVIGIDVQNILPEFIKNDKHVIFIQGDSTNHRTYRDFLNILKDKPIDFLYIDGLHSYLACKSDFYTYGFHVRKNGIIGFNDILFDPLNDYERGMAKHFWDEIKEKQKYGMWKVVYENFINTGTGMIEKSV